MEESIRNLSKMVMVFSLAHVRVSTCFMSKVYFGRGTFDLIDAHEKELRKTHKKPWQES